MEKTVRTANTARTTRTANANNTPNHEYSPKQTEKSKSSNANTKRNTVSFILKIALVVCSLLGVALSLINARRDGYSAWWRRLMYYTGQSNIWIGTNTLSLLLLPLFKLKNPERWKKRVYILKYVFTASITMTGIVFCFLLAPFADASYHAWSPWSYLTHVFSPILGAADFFVDEYRVPLRMKHVFATELPPLIYFSTASVLGILQVDFGRGEFYPYFFLNYTSPAGVFGFSNQFPFIIGSFYWMTLFALVMLGIGFLLAKLYNRKQSLRSPSKKTAVKSNAHSTKKATV